MKTETAVFGGGCFWCTEAVFKMLGGVVSVVPLASFYEAENYHRDYFAHHPDQAYCQLIISPKVAKVQKEFAELLKHD